jgi:hypothetical protein
MLALAMLAVPVAIADPGHGNGRGHEAKPSEPQPDPAHTPGAGPHENGNTPAPKQAKPVCKPVVSYILRGIVVSVGSDTVVMHVTAGNAHARVFAGQDVTLAVGTTTKIRRDGPAELSKLLAGDRLIVQVRGCKSAGATVAVAAVGIVAHAAPAGDEATSDSGTATNTGAAGSGSAAVHP